MTIIDMHFVAVDTNRTSKLQSELRQRRAFASEAQEAAVGLMRTTDLLKRHMASVIEPSGVTMQQYNVLRILRGAGADGLPRYEIAARMLYRAPDVTRLLDRLETRGLVRRARSDADRRLSLTQVTREGMALLGRMEPDIRAVHDLVAAPLTGADRRELARLCELLVS